MKNDINKLLSKREILEHRKRTLEDYLRDIKKHHVSGETWDIWEDMVSTRILIEEIKIEISRETIQSLKDSLNVYDSEIQRCKAIS